MKNLRIILSLLLMFPFMLYAQETETEKIVMVKVKSNEIKKDTCIHIEKITLKEDNTFFSDSLLKARNSEIIFVDKEGKKSSIHPDSLNTIPVNLIKKIMIQDKGKSKVVVIEEKAEMKDDETLFSDSLLKAGNHEIIFIDKEGKKSSIHPDSLNAIPVNLIEKIMIQDKGNGKVVVIEEKINAEDCTIKKDKPAKDKQKIKHVDIKLDIYSGEEEISEEEIKKIAEKIKNLFNPAEIEIKESKDENEQQVIHIRIVKNKKE